MATKEQINESLIKDETFLRLQTTDKEAAIRYATEAFKLADKPSTQPEADQAQAQAQAQVEDPQEGPVRTYVRPVLEATGAALGFIAGTPGGPVTQMTGGVLGAAGGSAVADVAEQVAGEQEPPRSVDEAISKTVENVKTGAIAEMGGQALSLGVKIGQKALKPLSHMIDPAKQKVLDLAEEMGVKLSAADITGSAPLATLVEGLSERVPFSAGIIKKFRMEGLHALVKRRNELIEKGGTPQSIEETGMAIQRRAQDLMDELGVTNDTVKQEMMDRVISNLGAKESFSAMGLKGQDALKGVLDTESKRVSGLYTKAFELAPAGERVVPTNLQKTAKEHLESYKRLPDGVRNSKVEGFLKYFSASGNKKFDEQQAFLRDALTGVPPRAMEQQKSLLLGDTPIEKFGHDPRVLNKDRAQLNAAIDEVDAGLRATGDTGVKGIGTAKTSEERRILLDLKGALDQDVKSFSDQYGGEFSGALQVARAAAGEFKGFANSQAVKGFLRAQPQEAARMLAQSKDIATIRQFKTMLGDSFKPVQDAFAGEVMGLGTDKTIGPSFLRGQLRKYKHGVAEAMLGEGQVAQIRKLASQLEDVDAAAIENPIFKRILKANPQSVVDLIVQPNNTANIEAIGKTLGPEAVADLARGVTNKILQKPTADIAEDAFLLSPAKLLSGLKRYGDDTLKALFKHDQTFLKDMKELSLVASASQGASKLAANPSGTGQSLVAWGEMVLMIAAPKLGFSIALGVPAVSKLYLSQAGRKWLTKGFKTNPNSPESAAIIGKILGLSAADATIPPPPMGEATTMKPLSVTEQSLSFTHPAGRTGVQLPSFAGAN